MLSDHQIEIRAAIEEMGHCFLKKPDDTQVEVYARGLERFSTEQVIFAFNQVIESGSDFFPSLGRILSYLRPKDQDPEGMAAVIADEIVNTAANFGYMQTGAAFLTLSPTAKLVCGSSSRLLDICNTERDNLTTVKAQLRKQAIGVLSQQKTNIHNEKLVEIGLATAEVLDFQKPALRSLAYGDFQPGA